MDRRVGREAGGRTAGRSGHRETAAPGVVLRGTSGSRDRSRRQRAQGGFALKYPVESLSSTVTITVTVGVDRDVADHRSPTSLRDGPAPIIGQIKRLDFGCVERPDRVLEELIPSARDRSEPGRPVRLAQLLDEP